MVNFCTSIGSNPNLVQTLVLISLALPTLRIHHMDISSLVSCYNLEIQHSVYHNIPLALTLVTRCAKLRMGPPPEWLEGDL